MIPQNGYYIYSYHRNIPKECGRVLWVTMTTKKQGRRAVLTALVTDIIRTHTPASPDHVTMATHRDVSLGEEEKTEVGLLLQLPPTGAQFSLIVNRVHHSKLWPVSLEEE